MTMTDEKMSPMADDESLVARFEGNRARLHAAAYRMLGSPSEADDAVQETWLRLSRAGADGIDNLDAWLTTVLARVCLDVLRSRTSRREVPVADHEPARVPADPGPTPEDEAVLADSVGLAMIVVLETLSPAERVAFVLHDLFAVPFAEIASVVGSTPAATRQLASRARRRVQGAEPSSDADRARQHEVVEAFLAASRSGDFAGLLSLLDPDVVLRADEVAAAMGADAEIRGAAEVAETFSGRAQGARLALVDGLAGAVWSQGGVPRVVFDFVVAAGRITAIDLVADPDVHASMELAPID
jgi:RNA polymerase sigma factor (sigma-70 family)